MWWQHQFPSESLIQFCTVDSDVSVFHKACREAERRSDQVWRKEGRELTGKGNRSYRTINKQGNVATKGKQGETQWTNKLCISATDRDGLRLSYRALFSQFVLGIDKQVTLHMSSQTFQQFSTPMKKGGRCQAGWVAVFFHSQPRLWALINTLVGSPNSSPAISSQCWRPAAYLPSNSLSADQLVPVSSLWFSHSLFFMSRLVSACASSVATETFPVWTVVSMDIWILDTCSASLCSPACPPPPSSWAVGHSQVKDAHPATCSRPTPGTLSTYF